MKSHNRSSLLHILKFRQFSLVIGLIALSLTSAQAQNVDRLLERFPEKHDKYTTGGAVVGAVVLAAKIPGGFYLFSLSETTPRVLTRADIAKLKQKGVAVMNLRNPIFNSAWEELAPKEFRAFKDAEAKWRQAEKNMIDNKNSALEAEFSKREYETHLVYLKRNSVFEKKLSAIYQPSFWQTSEGTTLELRLKTIVQQETVARLKSGCVRALSLTMFADAIAQFLIVCDRRYPGYFPILTAAKWLVEQGDE